MPNLQAVNPSNPPTITCPSGTYVPDASGCYSNVPEPFATQLVQSGLYVYRESYSTASRPTGQAVGQMVFDSTLGRPIWWNGSSWRFSDGSAA